LKIANAGPIAMPGINYASGIFLLFKVRNFAGLTGRLIEIQPDIKSFEPLL